MELITEAISNILERLDEENIRDLYDRLTEALQRKYETQITPLITELERQSLVADDWQNLDEKLVGLGAHKEITFVTLARTIMHTLNMDQVEIQINEIGAVIDEEYMMADFGGDEVLIIGGVSDDQG